MTVRKPLPRLFILWFCLAGLFACSSGGDSGPRAWIDFPRDGSTIPAGSFVTIVSHGYAEEGVGELLLSVNGEEYRRASPEETGAAFCEIRQEWLPEEAGLYTLQVRTYDVNGEASSPEAITVRVVSEVASEPTVTGPTTAAVTAPVTPSMTPSPTTVPVNTPTMTVTPTPVPLTATFTPTPVLPTTTFTPVPPTATFTPVPPTSTFTPIPIPPTPTLTPSPTSPPSDTTPPPVPILVVPADGLALSCRNTQTLAWLPVEDPSGITGYYVRLERQVTTNQWDPVREWGPVPDKQTDATDLQCGLFYRWSVRALDGAGNLSPWSDWSHFSILFG